MPKKTKINVPVEAETQPENLAETQPRNVSEPQIENLAETRRSSVGDLQPDNLSETQPNNTVLSEPVNIPETQTNGPDDTQPNVVVKKRGRAGLWLGLLVLILALILGSLAGYGKGVNERISAQGTLVGKQLGAQFDLVQQDIDAGRYSVAKQRLEYIIQQEPNFPGAADKLAEVLVKSAITPSPVPTDTPTVAALPSFTPAATNSPPPTIVP